MSIINTIESIRKAKEETDALTVLFKRKSHEYRELLIKTVYDDVLSELSPLVDQCGYEIKVRNDHAVDLYVQNILYGTCSVAVIENQKDKDSAIIYYLHIEFRGIIGLTIFAASLPIYNVNLDSIKGVSTRKVSEFIYKLATHIVNHPPLE